MKQKNNDQSSQQNSVNNGKAGNPAVNQHPSNDWNIQGSKNDRQKDGNPDRDINQQQGNNKKQKQSGNRE